VEFLFQKETPGWSEGIKKSYYIKFGDPPRYGSLQVATSLISGGAVLVYAINPEGSTNLEPQK
jgi:hypothetical protein